MTDTIVLASNNAGKLKEFNALFAERNIRILPQSQFVREECEIGRASCRERVYVLV